VDFIDNAPEAQAQTRLADYMQQESLIWERLQWAKFSKLPVSILEVIRAAGTMWLDLFQLSKRIRDVCNSAGWLQEQQASSPTKPGYRPRSGSILSTTTLDYNEAIHKKRLKLLKKWQQTMEKATDAWRDMRELEAAHIRGCLEWWVGDGKVSRAVSLIV
jgi:hypothetical protein